MEFDRFEWLISIHKTPIVAVSTKLSKIFHKHVRYFKPVLEKHYPIQSNSILAKMKKEFDALDNDLHFAIHSKNPMDRRIPLCGLFLSLVKVLDIQGEGYEKIRSTCLEVAMEFVTPKNSFQKKIKSLQGRLAKSWLFRLIVRQLKKRVKNKAYPDGFAVDIITRPEDTFGLGYGFDILECGICKLFNKHHFGHYTKILCEVDYLTSNLAGLELIRTGTIANGAKKCDFRFKQKK
ncbi:MAG: L-2-amino-thiazoline-4-carboxylic acid hydrolase [Bacteroidota bacterium]